jgi:hypothetical protein
MADLEEGLLAGEVDLGQVQSEELSEIMSFGRITSEDATQAHKLILEEESGLHAELFLALQAKVGFANQRDNLLTYESNRGGSCNLTALAMAMQAAGIANPYPELQYEEALDYVRQTVGGGSATSYAIWSAVVTAPQCGGSLELLKYDAAGFATDSEFWEEIRTDHLETGAGVMISHGGHIIRLQDVTDSGIVVDDPYGKTSLMSGTSIRFEQQNASSRGPNDADANAGEDLTYGWDGVSPHLFKGIWAVRA